MDELHAAIAAYLRGQRRTAEVRRPVTDAERSPEGCVRIGTTGVP